MLFVRLFGLCLFEFVGFLFLLVSRKGVVCDCGTPWSFLLPFVFIRVKFTETYIGDLNINSVIS